MLKHFGSITIVQYLLLGIALPFLGSDKGLAIYFSSIGLFLTLLGIVNPLLKDHSDKWQGHILKIVSLLMPVITLAVILKDGKYFLVNNISQCTSDIEYVKVTADSTSKIVKGIFEQKDIDAHSFTEKNIQSIVYKIKDSLLQKQADRNFKNDDCKEVYLKSADSLILASIQMKEILDNEILKINLVTAINKVLLNRNQTARETFLNTFPNLDGSTRLTDEDATEDNYTINSLLSNPIYNFTLKHITRFYYENGKIKAIYFTKQ